MPVPARRRESVPQHSVRGKGFCPDLLNLLPGAGDRALPSSTLSYFFLLFSFYFFSFFSIATSPSAALCLAIFRLFTSIYPSSFPRCLSLNHSPLPFSWTSRALSSPLRSSPFPVSISQPSRDPPRLSLRPAGRERRRPRQR